MAAVLRALAGGRVLWAFPTFASGTDAWERLVEATRAAAVEVSEVQRKVWLPGGGSITVRGTDNPNALRGLGFDLALLDECKDHPATAWPDVIRPTLVDTGGRAMILGTPGAIGSWSHVLFEEAKRDPEWKTWQLPTSVSPLIKASELEAARRSMGSVVFAREHQAQFISASGNMFKREWFKSYDLGALGYVLNGRAVRLDQLKVFAVLDAAATVKTRSDPSCIGVFGRDPVGRLLVLEIVHGKFEAPDLQARLHDVNTRWRPVGIFIESSAYTNLWSAVLKSQGLPIRELRADRDKVARAEVAVAHCEGGMVWTPRAAVWLDGFLSEVCEFPDGKHDDQVDVLAYGAAVAVTGRGPATTPAYEPAPGKPMSQLEARLSQTLQSGRESAEVLNKILSEGVR
jgi:predicted phage terminase large subunit-like protein